LDKVYYFLTIIFQPLT